MARDQHCPMPYCTAPIRHLDHITPWRDGGPTTATNGQGLCERHPYTKEAPGWHLRVIEPDGPDRSVHSTVIITPQRPHPPIPSTTRLRLTALT